MFKRILAHGQVAMNKGLDATIDALKKVRDGEDIALSIEQKIVKIVNQNEKIQYVIEGFRNKYRIGTRDLFIAPLVKAGSYNIEEYALCLGEYPIIRADGFDKLIDAVTKAVLVEDPDVQDAIRGALR